MRFKAVLQRSGGTVFKAAVNLLRRRGNMTLREVAALAGISAACVSQIQAEIENTAPDERLLELPKTINLKN